MVPHSVASALWILRTLVPSAETLSTLAANQVDWTGSLPRTQEAPELDEPCDPGILTTAERQSQTQNDHPTPTTLHPRCLPLPLELSCPDHQSPHHHRARLASLVASILSDHPKLYTYFTLTSPFPYLSSDSDFLTVYLYQQLGARHSEPIRSSPRSPIPYLRSLPPSSSLFTHIPSPLPPHSPSAPKL